MHRGFASTAHRQGCVGVCISEGPYSNPGEVPVSTGLSCTPVLALGMEGRMRYTSVPVWPMEQGAAEARNI